MTSVLLPGGTASFSPRSNRLVLSPHGSAANAGDNDDP
jgi:hypothetical protein